MSFFDIAGQAVGPGERTLVIAEIGVNHDGSLSRAVQLVEQAARGGADVVKLQVFSADRLVHPSAPLAEYQQGSVDQNDQATMLREYELPPIEIAQLAEVARSFGLITLATPFSTEDVDLIEHLGFPAIKIASPDLVNRVLLERCAQLNRPMIVSTGAATMSEVENCVTWLSERELPFALMHCVSAYPVPIDDANLRWINELAERFHVPVGYSDHTTEQLAGAFAVAGGASMVEKHLTYHRSAVGPDHAVSADPGQFAEYVRAIRLAERMRGTGSKRVLPIELDVRTISRQSLVLRRDIAAGEMIEDSDLIVQRPGTGITPADARLAIGRRARRSLKTGTLLQWDMLSDAA